MLRAAMSWLLIGLPGGDECYWGGRKFTSAFCKLEADESTSKSKTGKKVKVRWEGVFLLGLIAGADDGSISDNGVTTRTDMRH